MSRQVQKRLKELAAAVKAEPASIPKRLELAAALRESGRAAEAIEIYRGVAALYAGEGRLVQAMAVCKGILEIDPTHRETLEMLAELALPRARRGGDEGHEAASADADPWETAPATEVTDARPRAAMLDFPPETKRHARGHRLLDLPPPPEPSQFDTDPMLAGPSADEEPRGELTRAASPRALDSGRPPSEAPADSDEALALDNQAEDALLADVLAGPLPAAELGEPPPFPLLSDLPRRAFVELLSRLTMMRLEANVPVLVEGDVGDACYLIASGHVRVTKGGVELAVLGPGSFFGEFAVLADQTRHASVETIEPVELLEIKRKLLDELVAAHPGVARTLRSFYRQRLLDTLLQTAPFFQRLTVGERAAIAERFRPRRFGRGAEIIEEGASGGGLYLILVGEVAVVHGRGADEVPLATLGEGSYFGEMSLLKDGVASATVRAARLTEVVQLPPRDFYEVVSEHPVLWDQLRAEAEQRELANHAILAGEARKSDDGTIYLV
jgi:CRP-like cAMP-binding protein